MFSKRLSVVGVLSLLFITGALATPLGVRGGVVRNIAILYRGPKQWTRHVDVSSDDPMASLYAMARRAQTLDRRVVFTIGNHHAVLTQLPLYLMSMRMSDSADMTAHLIVVCTDVAALDMCRRVHRWCWCDGCDAPPQTAAAAAGAEAAPPLASGDAGGSAPTDADAYPEGNLKGGSQAFSAIGWRRQEVAAGLVNAGFDTIATDMDIVVFQNFLRDDVLDYASGADILVQKELIWPDDRRSNIGFYFARSTAATRQFFAQWLHESNRPQWDQQVWNDILLNGTVPGLRWQHISPLAGINICVVNRVTGLATRSFQDWRLAADALWGNADVKRQAVFFHCACWRRIYEFSKHDAMNLALSMFHQVRNGLRQSITPSACELKLDNVTRAAESLNATVVQLTAAGGAQLS